MKKQLLVILISAFFGLYVHAQTQLWGTAMAGGASGHGTIFYADGSGNNFQQAASIYEPEGSTPLGIMVLADNNSLYGECLHGGASDSCVIFRFDPYTGVYTMVYDFFTNPSNGVGNYGGMVKGTDGMLYGLGGSGGTGSAGVIYKVNPLTDTYTKIYDLSTSTGSSPSGHLVQLSDGKLYGMTYGGGANSSGVIFSYDPVTSNYNMLYSFDTLTGGHPVYGSLFQASNGKLYGMTPAGGLYHQGVIFSFDLSTLTYDALHHFDGLTGSKPQATFAQASNGLLYAATYFGGTYDKGVLFSFNIQTNTYTSLVNFDSINGEYPRRGLTASSSGLLFGTTTGGGVNAMGVAFKFDIATNTFTKIHDFWGLTTGNAPDAELLETPVLTPVITSISCANPSGRLNAYPNPAGSIITVDADDSEQVISFFDVAGRKLTSIKTSSLQRTSVDVSGFPNIFFLKTQSREVKKIVRN